MFWSAGVGGRGPCREAEASAARRAASPAQAAGWLVPAHMATAKSARAYFHREYVETGVLDPNALAGGMHCMSPVYLENQIERSRGNLGLETIDLFYIHNPESQLADVSREVFRQRLKDAFALLEKMVKAGKLQYYGVATWSAFRVAESSGAAASVDDHLITSTAAREPSSSRTTVTTRTPRTATRMHPTTPLNTATGTVRRTAAHEALGYRDSGICNVAARERDR